MVIPNSSADFRAYLNIRPVARVTWTPDSLALSMAWRVRMDISWSPSQIVPSISSAISLQLNLQSIPTIHICDNIGVTVSTYNTTLPHRSRHVRSFAETPTVDDSLPHSRGDLGGGTPAGISYQDVSIRYVLSDSSYARCTRHLGPVDVVCKPSFKSAISVPKSASPHALVESLHLNIHSAFDLLSPPQILTFQDAYRCILTLDTRLISAALL